MGEVHRARDTRLSREVAIKVLPEAFARDADRLQRFEHEARVLSTVNHPNILAVHDVGAQGDRSHRLLPTISTSLNGSSTMPQIAIAWYCCSHQLELTVCGDPPRSKKY
jgi:serine/threonine protein kinase